MKSRKPKKYRNIYFDKIGYKDSCTEQLYYQMRKDKRNKQWCKERNKWGGWDERCSWDLDIFMAEQIYTWLNIYLEKANVNLDWYVFEITFDTGKNYIKKTHGEWINEAINYLQDYFKLRYSYENIDRDLADDKLSKVFIILSKIFPAMWW